MSHKTQISRRNILRTAGSIGAVGVLGTQTAGASGNGPSDRYIVGMEPGRAGEARDAASEVHREFDFGDIGQAVSGYFTEEALQGLENNPNVRYIEANGEMEALEQTVPWGIDRVGATVLHDEGETGNGADIAILDTGIDSDHYDLADLIGGGKCFTDDCCGEATGGIFGCDDNDNECLEAWDDDNDHGTHCAGTAGAIDNSEGVVGVSTEATLWAGKVLTGCGSGSYDAIAAGIEWTADQGFDVASMSLGGDESSVVKDACQYAYDKGVLLVAAAGNDGECTDCVGSPAAYDEVIAVSATSEEDSLASFSSTGPEVELAAPGEGVLSTVPTETSSDGLETFSGTSMACPHVSGAGAQLMANGYANTEARQQLRDTAEDIGLGDNEQGYGLLDAEAAVLDGDSDDGGDDTDEAPSVSWVTPSDGDTVSDTVTVQIDASDAEDSDDSLDVSYTVAGGSDRSTSYNSDSGYYEDDWDTTTADDGDSTLEATATDSAGNSSSSSIAVTVDNSSDEDGGDTAPTVDDLSVTDNSNPSWSRYDVDWAVSDDDGDLAEVTSEMIDSAGSVLDSQSSSVSGTSASGTHDLRSKSSPSEIVVTVTDEAGNSDSGSQSI